MQYLTNDEFLKRIYQYRETRTRRDYNKLAECFMLVAKNLLNKPNFINYSNDRKADMMSEALFFMTKYHENYTADYAKKHNIKENPFAFFTMVAWNGFVQIIKKYKYFDTTNISLNFFDSLETSTTNQLSELNNYCIENQDDCEKIKLQEETYKLELELEVEEDVRHEVTKLEKYFESDVNETCPSH